MSSVSKGDLVFGAILSIVGIATAYFGSQEDKKMKAFMIECQDDAFKRYQCEALWRGSYAILDIPAVRNGLK